MAEVDSMEMPSTTLMSLTIEADKEFKKGSVVFDAVNPSDEEALALRRMQKELYGREHENDTYKILLKIINYILGSTREERANSI